MNGVGEEKECDGEVVWEKERGEGDEG